MYILIVFGNIHLKADKSLICKHTTTLLYKYSISLVAIQVILQQNIPTAWLYT